MTDTIGTQPGTASPVGPRVRTRAGTWVTLVLLAVYTGFVLWVTLTPRLDVYHVTGTASRVLAVLHRLGMPHQFGYGTLEFTANIAMFVPLGVLVGLALPRRAVWWGILLLPAFSAAIEVTQGAVLPGRVADVRDVISNGLGGWIGLVLAVGIRVALNRRDRSRIAPAAGQVRRPG